MANRAPGPLGLVHDFVNTLELEDAADAIGTPESLGTWLAAQHLLDGEGVTAGDHARALDLREALRRLLLANNGEPPEDADLALLNQMARDSGLRPRFSTGAEVILEPTATGVPGALGRLLGAVSAAMNEGTWGRLKACGDPTCRWVFYDRSKNHSGHWCSMEVCGNRAKARQFRQRRRAAAAG
jgi:predicted RNA-binding Zn ribbon-like protein